MKSNRDATALAERLSTAANKPLPVPESHSITEVERPEPAKYAKQKASKPPIDKVAITLRPSRDLLNRYTLAAAERTRQSGRVVSAQEMMIEILEREL